MSSQAGLTKAGGDFQGPSLRGDSLSIMVVMLFVTMIVSGLVLLGRVSGYYVMVVPLMALLSSVVGAKAPRFLLKSLFVSAPLIWALGNASLLPVGAPQVNLPMLAGFVLIMAFSPQMLIKDPDPGIEKIRKLVLVFALACIPAMFSAQDIFTGAGVYLRIICPFIAMFAVLRSIRSGKDVVLFVRSMAFALIAVAVVLVIAWWRTELWLDFGGYTRLTALHLPTQDFAEFLSVMIFVVLLNYLVTRKPSYLVLLPFNLIALYLTYFRTAWIGAALLLVLLTFEVKKSYGRMLLVTGLVACAIYSPAVSRSLLRYDTNVDSASAINKVVSGRVMVDAIALGTYLEAPLYNKMFGIGYYRSKSATRLILGQGFMIHDDYLAFFVEAGVFALPIYLAILVILLRRSLQSRRKARERISYHMYGAAAILLVTVMIMGIPGAFYTEVLSNVYVYGIMGLMLSLARIAEAPRGLPMR